MILVSSGYALAVEEEKATEIEREVVEGFHLVPPWTKGMRWPVLGSMRTAVLGTAPILTRPAIFQVALPFL